MKTRWIFVVIFLLLGCGVKIHNSFDPTIDFSKYKTFCWMQGCEFTYSGPGYLNEQKVKEMMQAAIIAEMEEKGIRYNAERPDLLLDVHITMQNEVVPDYHRRPGDELYYRFYEDPDTINLLQGTLVIDMADKSESRMVYRSVAMAYMDLHPELSRENLQRGIHQVLRKFPPKANTTSRGK